MPSFANHIHTCKNIFDRLNVFKKKKYDLELALLGSVLVDLDEIGVVPQIHGKSRAFLEYLVKNDPDYFPLGIGMVMHEEHDAVIDSEFVHPNEKIAKGLVIKHANSFSTNHMVGHYLLDHAMDFHLIQNNPKVMEEIKSITKNLKVIHAKRITYHLSKFFGGNYYDILQALLKFKEFDLSKFETLEGVSDIWMTYVFLKVQKNEIAMRQKLGIFEKLKSNIKLGINYGAFRINHKKEDIIKLFSNALNKFSGHAHIFKKAEKALEKSLIKITEQFPVPKILNKHQSKMSL